MGYYELDKKLTYGLLWIGSKNSGLKEIHYMLYYFILIFLHFHLIAYVCYFNVIL